MNLKANELFPELARVVGGAHKKVEEACEKLAKEATQRYGLSLMAPSGHDFDHDLRVANYALIIAPDARTARLAAAAGFCHSADRLLGSKVNGCVENLEISTDVESLVRKWLNVTDLTSTERDEVVYAVLHHEGANKETDTALQITLCDADRLANLDADVIIRGGQFQPDLLAVDPVHLENDPEATYFNPRSVLWDVKNCISWTEESGPYVLRLPKARELGALRGEFLRFFVYVIREQRAAAGLIPYPKL